VLIVRLSSPVTDLKGHYEVVVVGSGYGGAHHGFPPGSGRTAGVPAGAGQGAGAGRVPGDRSGSSAGSADVYLPHLERLAVPITFIHGQENSCFLPESTAHTLELLQQHNGPQLYRRHVIPNYGHIDCIFGKRASRDVFPLILEHLEATR
jgi:choline dehydrogenase-like flavoprotein